MSKQSLRWVTIIIPVGFLALTFIISDFLITQTVHLGKLASCFAHIRYVRVGNIAK